MLDVSIVLATGGHGEDLTETKRVVNTSAEYTESMAARTSHTFCYVTYNLAPCSWVGRAYHVIAVNTMAQTLARWGSKFVSFSVRMGCKAANQTQSKFVCLSKECLDKRNRMRF